MKIIYTVAVKYLNLNLQNLLKLSLNEEEKRELKLKIIYLNIQFMLFF